MGKLFIKLWVLLLLTSYSSWAIQTAVFDWTRAHAQIERPRTPFLTTTAETVAWALRDVPTADWARQFAEIGPKLTYPSELIPINGLLERYPIDQSNIPRLQAGANVYTSTGEGLPWLGIKRLTPSDLVLVVKLPPDESMLIFGMFSSTTFTWLIESTMYASAVLLWLSLFWRDLSKLIGAADKIGSGDFSFVANVRKGSALRPLANSLSRMTTRIAALVHAHKSLTTAVSHELRNPLMRLHFRHLLARDAEQTADKNRNLDLMAEDLDELDRLVDEMLTYAKLERLEPEIRMETVDIVALTEHAVDGARQLALAQGKNITIEESLSVATARGEAHYLERAINNLLSNAIRHAQSRVCISFAQVDGKSQLAVDDDGAGIPELERAMLFEPFARLDGSRARNTGGFGMGLAITRRVAHWHGGDVRIETSPLGGARFVMSW